MRGVPGLKIRPVQGRPEALRACHWNQRKKPQRAPRVGAFPPRARGPARPLGLIKAVGLTFCNAPAPGPPIFWRLSAQPRDKTFFFLKRCATLPSLGQGKPHDFVVTRRVLRILRARNCCLQRGEGWLGSALLKQLRICQKTQSQPKKALS